MTLAVRMVFFVEGYGEEGAIAGGEVADNILLHAPSTSETGV